MTPPGNDQDDLTRKQRREQARGERKALQEAEAARAVRRKRMAQLGGVAGAVVVIILVIVLATGGNGKGSSNAPTKDLAAHSSEIAAVKSLLAGIPQNGNVLGNPNAKATMQYFGDLECPICQEFTLGSLPTIVEKFVRPGKLKLEYRSLSTATGNAEHDGSEPQGTFDSQQVAALAAGKQNLMWYFVELFYHEQGAEGSGYVTEAFIQGLAQQVPGLDLTKWTADRSDTTLVATVESDAQAAAKEGFEGTPSFLIGKTGSTLETFSPSTYNEPSSFLPTLEKLVA